MSYTYTQSRLERTYREFNKKFFFGSLPKARVRLVKRVGAEGEKLLGLTSVKPLLPPEIKVKNCYSGGGASIINLTLLHEMAHLATWHSKDKGRCGGPVWQAEMHRLSNMGAFERWW